MLYHIIKIPARIALSIFCKKIEINKKEITQIQGPVLIACNHPNTFLDAILLATLFKKPIYSLARGDAFKNNFVGTLLNTFKILPVYRLSEGAENLNNNYDTFSKCKEIFKKNGIVLIFSEGLCKNEWKLRPLKKGTARLAFSSWEDNIELTVIPAGINYHSFKSFGKHVKMNFENPIEWKDLNHSKMSGSAILSFNNILKTSLEKAVIHLETDDTHAKKIAFPHSISIIKKKVLFIPAFIGRWAHAPLYIPVKNLAWKKTKHNEFYDAVLVGLLFFLYPLYLLILAFSFYLIFGNGWGFLSFIIFPLLAWASIQSKEN